MTDRLVSEEAGEGVRLIRFSRPEKLNAFDRSARCALSAALKSCEDAAAVRAVVLTGGEAAFVAGADLKEVKDAGAEQMAQAGLHHVWDALDRFPKPLIVAVRGYALGAGCELALTADILIVAEDATLGQPEIKVGIQPGAGGISRMAHRIGWTRTMLLAMTGRTISGATAAAWGLAAEAAPTGEVLPRALAIAAEIAALPAERQRSIKAVARAALDLPLSEALARERAAYWESFGSRDQREGMAAFLEKRKARFNAG